MSENAASDPMELPQVTVIMAVRNEEQFITRSLGSVLTQDYPRDRLDVVIADGMSTDYTRQKIAALSENGSAVSIKLINNPGRVVSKGLNLALREARGDVIVRVDGHTELASDYVRQCVSLLQSTSADTVGGRMDPVGQGPIGQAIALATTSRFGVGDASFHYSHKQQWVDTVYMGAWRRSLFSRFGAFDERPARGGDDDQFNNRLRNGAKEGSGAFDERIARNQDDDFNYRIREKGGRILLSPLIRSTYVPRETLTGLWHQYYLYGLWKVRVLQKHPFQMRPRQFVPPAFVGTVAILGIGSVGSRRSRRTLMGVVSIYTLASLASTILMARRAKSQVVRNVPLVYAIMHIGYGAGFLKGLWVFRNEWEDSWRHFTRSNRELR